MLLGLYMRVCTAEALLRSGQASAAARTGFFRTCVGGCDAPAGDTHLRYVLWLPVL